MTTVKDVLTSSFWSYLANHFSTAESEVGALITSNSTAILNYTNIKYSDLLVFDVFEDMSPEDIAYVVYVDMGDAFNRVYKAVTADYNPLENFFTEREYEDNNEHSDEYNETLVKTGKYTTTPSGSIVNSKSGERDLEIDGGTSVNQGTTYDTASSDPDSSGDFLNISKNIVNSNQKEKFTNYSSTTSYNNYKVEVDYGAEGTQNTGLKDKKTGDKSGDYKNSGEEHKHGSSGIFSKQDLTKREIQLRIRDRIIPILCRMVVDVVNSGVWKDA